MVAPMGRGTFHAGHFDGTNRCKLSLVVQFTGLDAGAARHALAGTVDPGV